MCCQRFSDRVKLTQLYWIGIFKHVVSVSLNAWFSAIQCNVLIGAFIYFLSGSKMGIVWSVMFTKVTLEFRTVLLSSHCHVPLTSKPQVIYLFHAIRWRNWSSFSLSSINFLFNFGGLFQMSIVDVKNTHYVTRYWTFAFINLITQEPSDTCHSLDLMCSFIGYISYSIWLINMRWSCRRSINCACI